MNARPVIYYECRECHYLHTEPEEAIECCSPGYKETYACPECRELHDEEADAIKCCSGDPDAPPPPPSPAELEAAGQLRLLP